MAPSEVTPPWVILLLATLLVPVVSPSVKKVVIMVAVVVVAVAVAVVAGALRVAAALTTLLANQVGISGIPTCELHEHLLGNVVGACCSLGTGNVIFCNTSRAILPARQDHIEDTDARGKLQGSLNIDAQLCFEPEHWQQGALPQKQILRIFDSIAPLPHRCLAYSILCSRCKSDNNAWTPWHTIHAGVPPILGRNTGTRSRFA